MNTFTRSAWRCTRCQSLPSSSLQDFATARAQWRRQPPTAFRQPTRRSSTQPGDREDFRSIADEPSRIVRLPEKKHGPGLIVLAAMPIVAFALGTWQVQRLGWKTDLMAKFEDRLTRDPLPLPPSIDPSAIKEFDYRPVLAAGTFRHDQEMLIGPRMYEGQNGYNVITPLERKNGTTILVSRGWIAKKFKEQKDRAAEAMPTGEVVVSGLLREPIKKNMFTPDNNVEKGEFYFTDIPQMAELTGAQPVWVEETMEEEFMETVRRQEAGIPIGRPPGVTLTNNHAQYIFTWYSLSLATSVMFWMVVRKTPPTGVVTRAVQREW